jgi:hypothetical protein
MDRDVAILADNGLGIRVKGCVPKIVLDKEVGGRITRSHERLDKLHAIGHAMLPGRSESNHANMTMLILFGYLHAIECYQTGLWRMGTQRHRGKV